jgi:hypothetical protein
MRAASYDAPMMVAMAELGRAMSRFENQFDRLSLPRPNRRGEFKNFHGLRR